MKGEGRERASELAVHRLPEGSRKGKHFTRKDRKDRERGTERGKEGAETEERGNKAGLLLDEM